MKSVDEINPRSSCSILSEGDAYIIVTSPRVHNGPVTQCFLWTEICGTVEQTVGADPGESPHAPGLGLVLVVRSCPFRHQVECDPEM